MKSNEEKNREIIMARSVMILILIASIAECSVMKNIDNLPSTETNHLVVVETESKLQSTKMQLELEKREAEVKFLREIVTKLNTVLKQQAEDISIRSSKEEQFHIVSYCQFLSAICIIGAIFFHFLVKLIYF